MDSHTKKSCPASVNGETKSIPRTFHELKCAVQASAMPTANGGTEAMLHMLALDDFFRVVEIPPGNLPSHYNLPEGFLDWEEWETIVVSKLRATVTLALGGSESLNDFQELSLQRLAMIGKFSEGITHSYWLQIFGALQKNGSVQIEDALSFFQRADKRRENFKLNRTNPLHLRQSIMVQEWIHFPDSTRSFCTFDNASAALLLDAKEKGNDELADGMSGPNFSREKTKLGLISCKKPIRKSWISREGILTEER